MPWQSFDIDVMSKHIFMFSEINSALNAGLKWKINPVTLQNKVLFFFWRLYCLHPWSWSRSKQYFLWFSRAQYIPFPNGLGQVKLPYGAWRFWQRFFSELHIDCFAQDCRNFIETNGLQLPCTKPSFEQMQFFSSGQVQNLSSVKPWLVQRRRHSIVYVPWNYITFAVTQRFRLVTMKSIQEQAEANTIWHNIHMCIYTSSPHITWLIFSQILTIDTLCGVYCTIKPLI